MNKETIIQLYNSNKDFKDYVDSYSKKYNEGKSISVDESFEHSLVKEVAKTYVNEDKSYWDVLNFFRKENKNE